MAFSDWFGPKVEEEEPEPQPEPDQPPQYATVDQMQQMVQGVAAQLQENLVGLMRGQQQPEHQQQTYQPVPEPSLDDINEAYEIGDTKKALQLQAQRELAREQRYQAQLIQLRQEGASAFAEINGQLLGSQVPDYKRYEKDVAKKMDEYGLGKEFRTNPKIVKLITDAVKGEKFEELYAERQEAQKRQENDAPAGEIASRRNSHLNSTPKAVLSEEAELALRFAGKDKEQFAKSRGHGSWQEYEKNAAAFQAAKRGEGSYVPKWRRK